MTRPTAAPPTDDECWPFPCEDYHGTWTHLEGADPCDCRCHDDDAARTLVVAAITVDATDADHAERIARALWAWPGELLTTFEVVPGTWHVALHAAPRAVAVR